MTGPMESLSMIYSQPMAPNNVDRRLSLLQKDCDEFPTHRKISGYSTKFAFWGMYVIIS